MKKFLSLCGFIAFNLVCALCLSSCSGGGDGDGDDFGAGENIGDIQGFWEIYGVNGNNEKVAFTLLFNSDGTGNLSTYVSDEDVYVRDISSDFRYDYNPANGKLKVSDGYETQEWQVMKVTAEKLTISISGQLLTFDRCHGSGPGGNPDDNPGVLPDDEPETSYALDNVSDYEFTLYKYNKSYVRLYFTSNRSINTYYSYCSWSEPVSATYEKVSGNAALINYIYEGSSGTSKQMPFSLIFTSETGGKVLYEGGVTDVFTCEKKEKDSDASAPYNISNMTFTTKYASTHWYKFGQQVSNLVPVTSYKANLTYEDIYATYKRSGSKGAEIVIFTKLGSYANWEEHKYILDFYTSTEGRFTYYHKTSSYSGEFTLK